MNNPIVSELDRMINEMDDKRLIREIHRMQCYLKDLYDLYNDHLEYYNNLTNEYIERSSEHGKQGKN